MIFSILGIGRFLQMVLQKFNFRTIIKFWREWLKAGIQTCLTIFSMSTLFTKHGKVKSCCVFRINRSKVFKVAGYGSCYEMNCIWLSQILVFFRNNSLVSKWRLSAGTRRLLLFFHNIFCLNCPRRYTNWRCWPFLADCNEILNDMHFIL